MSEDPSKPDFIGELLWDLISATEPNRALDWRIYASVVNRDACARLGAPGAWCPRDIEDRDFKRWADELNIPYYTIDLPAAVHLVNVTVAARKIRPIGQRDGGTTS